MFVGGHQCGHQLCQVPGLDPEPAPLSGDPPMAVLQDVLGSDPRADSAATDALPQRLRPASHRQGRVCPRHQSRTRVPRSPERRQHVSRVHPPGAVPAVQPPQRQCPVHLGTTCNTSHAATDYHSELATLHKFVVTLVTTLLEDQVNSVKQVLVTESSAKLAVWFGRQKATDVLLSHMITFLNDKEDSQLR